MSIPPLHIGVAVVRRLRQSNMDPRLARQGRLALLEKPDAIISPKTPAGFFINRAWRFRNPNEACLGWRNS